MTANEVHSELKKISKGLPIIAFTEKVWKQQIESFSKEYFGELKAVMIETPLDGIYADLTVLTPNPNVDYSNFERAKVEDYKLEFTLKTKENSNSFISKHRINFRYISFDIISKDGGAFLEKEDEKYVSVPPLLNSEEERLINFETLKKNYNYTDAQIEYFTNQQESSAGFLVANGFLERLTKPFKIIDFSTMFPKIAFSGSFSIESIKINNANLIAFSPESFERKEPTECEIEEQHNRSFGTGEYKNGEFTVGGGTYPSTTKGKAPRIDNTKSSEIYFYLPNDTSEKLFQPKASLTIGTKIVLLKSADSWEIPPFLISHKALLSTKDKVGVSWDGNRAFVRLKLGVYLDFFVKVWIKVFRLKTKLGSADSSSQYVMDYKGELIEFYNGDLGFVGELWDPTNFSITNLQLDTILPDSIDRVASKILKYVLEPFIRFFITKLMITVTWPLVSAYIFHGLAGVIGNVEAGSSNGRNPYSMPKIKLNNYVSDNDSMSIGITRELDNLG